MRHRNRTRAPLVVDLYSPLWERAGGPALYAGRARARARAKYTRKSRNLNFLLGQFYFRSRQKLFSFLSLATVQNLKLIRADFEKLWPKSSLYFYKIKISMRIAHDVFSALFPANLIQARCLVWSKVALYFSRKIADLSWMCMIFQFIFMKTTPLFLYPKIACPYEVCWK